jgi:hypothetical protein
VWILAVRSGLPYSNGIRTRSALDIATCVRDTLYLRPPEQDRPVDRSAPGGTGRSRLDCDADVSRQLGQRDTHDGKREYRRSMADRETSLSIRLHMSLQDLKRATEARHRATQGSLEHDAAFANEVRLDNEVRRITDQIPTGTVTKDELTSMDAEGDDGQVFGG